ncbi:MAG: hypothetical protein D8M59_04290 [Planctomycetes bacterium]|nr:hypothetical protein [Planctomycetota bacterium]NOG55727.1 hypothetical protein [Planctomycetota bacterium]
MSRRILLGDEALALAAVHAGASSALSYPGAPATEIQEAFRAFHRHQWPDQQQHSGPTGAGLAWSTNEKSAYATALGHSYAGRRVLVSMNHLGLNTAMGPFMASALTGANGGLVVAVADDPGMHASQSGQDSRFLADFAQIPCLEPWDQQAVYDWTRQAFDCSEQLQLPVIIRLVTRLCHSRSAVETRPAVAELVERAPVSDWRDWTLVPSTIKPGYERLTAKQERLVKRLSDGPFYVFDEEGDRTFGVIACGTARNYVYEAFERYGIRHPVLAVGAYTIPDQFIHRMFKLCDRVLVVENGMPFIERKLHAAALTDRETLIGRMTGHLPAVGELAPGVVAIALEADVKPPAWPFDQRAQKPTAARPPSVCEGCAHVEVIDAITQVMAGDREGRVFGDVGCYTMAETPPYEAIETCVETGASIAMAVGASLAGITPAIAVIGDAAFTHSGLAGLRDAVRMNANLVVMISDNRPVLHDRDSSSLASGSRLYQLAQGCGVDVSHIHVIGNGVPGHGHLVDALQGELEYDGPSVIICQHPCHHPTDAEDDFNRTMIECASILDEGEEPVADAPDLTREIVVAGVGGQGVRRISEAICQTAARAGLAVKQAETHGTSQDGESRISHVRYRPSHVHSDLVQQGTADLVLAIEPLEALRWIGYLGPKGHLITSVRPVLNIPAYPYLEIILQRLREVPGHTLLDAERLAHEAGSRRLANLVMLGAASALLGFDDDAWTKTIGLLWGSVGAETGNDVGAMARTAFEYGQNAAAFYRALLDARIEMHDALVVASNVKPCKDAASFAPAWGKKLRSLTEREVLIHLDEATELQPADPSEIAFPKSKHRAPQNK